MTRQSIFLSEDGLPRPFQGLAMTFFVCFQHVIGLIKGLAIDVIGEFFPGQKIVSTLSRQLSYTFSLALLKLMSQ